MPEHVSIFLQMGVAFLAVATVVWVVGLVRLVRHVGWGTERPLASLPGQGGPALESVPLTPDERDAFAGLVRQFSVLLRGTPGVHPREESHPVVAMRSIAAATGAERTQETG
ncbi:hypothetical protein, partial [Streptomyces sp. NPDC055140]